MRFDSPLAFILLIFLPLFLDSGLGARFIPPFGKSKKSGGKHSEGGPASLALATGVDLNQLPLSLRQRLRAPMLSCLFCTSFLLLVTALARPQTGTEFIEPDASGRDILMVLDTSRSMSALDFAVDGKRAERLDALKNVVGEFVNQRQGDRLGLVVFGEEVYTTVSVNSGSSNSI